MLPLQHCAELDGLDLEKVTSMLGSLRFYMFHILQVYESCAHPLLAAQVDAGVKGVSPGPFTEEFLTAQQRNLRILGGLSMAGRLIVSRHELSHSKVPLAHRTCMQSTRCCCMHSFFAMIICRADRLPLYVLLLAGLAVASHLFDAACITHVGFSLNSISLILMSGFITTAHRQVCVHLLGPHT